MTLNEELNQALDFQAVLETIAGLASFESSAAAIRQSSPHDSIHQAREELELAREAADYLQAGSDLNMAGITDIRPLTKMARKNHTLTPRELADVYLFLCAMTNVKKQLAHSGKERLEDMAAMLQTDKPLQDMMGRMLDLSGAIKPDATPRLESLARSLQEAKFQLANAGRQFVKSHGDALMENMTTTVSGRLCVLLKASHKNAYGGMIHGSSQSGQAFYVEPQILVDRNNEVQSIQLEMEEEKNTICQELTRQVKRQADAFDSGLEVLVWIDMAMAKARWMHQRDGSIPLITTEDRKLSLLHALHPLLDLEKGVANDYALSQGLMLSGPNMGGKTVSMKTIGISVVLALSGFPVPAHSAVIPWYDHLFFDIGDRQSIENNLSTFSSHMTGIAGLLQHAGSHTFALLDEIGNGTDPAQGAGLAAAILQRLLEAGSTFVTTTHYSQVKSWAAGQKDVLISSMEFDSETLLPTYRYLPGKSGASYAFEIASSCGIPQDLLDEAEAFRQRTASRMEQELENLERLQEQARQKQERFDALIADAHKLQKDAANEKEKWEKKYERLETEYRQELEARIRKKEAEADAILKSMQSAQKLHEQIEQKHQISSLVEKAPEKEAKETFAVGDYVRVLSLNSHGEILELKKKEATILSNGMKVRVKLNQLEKMARPVIKKPVRQAKVDSVAARFPLELNIIGMRVEEGLRELDHYLDQAVVHRVTQVRIIHGMGTGRLRQAVLKDLQMRSGIKSVAAAGPADGGLGATIVTLR